MESESAVMALFGPELEELKRLQREPPPELEARIAAVRADYERQLDARFAGARGFVDAVIAPDRTRAVLAFALFTALHHAGPHLGPFGLQQLPER
jgi:acetyl-CoA carboxylase carboxyltransferase component